MTLTLGTGPLGRTDGQFNFDLAGVSPAHRLYLQPYGLRVRAAVAGTMVLDTQDAQLLHETGIPPRVYAPLQDFRTDLLTRTGTSTHCPFKGDASYWSLATGDATVPDAVWGYESPLAPATWLEGLAAVDPAHVEAWFVEEDRAIGGIKDPYHRVDVFSASRTVEVLIHGEVVARSARAMLLAETGLPVRPYLPSIDVQVVAAHGSGLRTVCPYKGEASYWTVAGVQDVAWSYELPLAEAAAIQGHWAFDDAKDGVEVRFAD
jgi:uncharacterized protein (DUF427 family)